MKPHLINFGQLGEMSLGYISIATETNLPFEIKRTFWTYFTPESVIRGRHAHYETEMIIVAVSGRIILNTELLNGEKDTFILEKPDVGVYIPILCWHTMLYSHSAVQLVLVSTVYRPEDYIRDYDFFLSLKNNDSKIHTETHLGAH